MNDSSEVVHDVDVVSSAEAVETEGAGEAGTVEVAHFKDIHNVSLENMCTQS